MARYDRLRTGSFLLAAFSGAFAFAACGGGEHTRPEAMGGTGAAGAGGSMAGTAGTGGDGSSASAGTSGAGGSTGGSSGTTASGGSSGGSCLGTGDNPLIANFDGDSVPDAAAPNNYTRSMGLLPGGTYAYVDTMDTTATIVTALTPMGHTCQGLSVTITSTSWRGSGFWTTAPVDASSYTGISFWARGSNITGVTVSVGSETTTMPDDAGVGGTCMTTCTRPQATITLSDTWTQYDLYWSDFAPGEADGVTIVADGAGLNGIDFSYTTVTGTSTAAEFVLDDVSFLTGADPGSGGTGGTGGTAGSAGSAGSAGAAGNAGSAGSAGEGGTAGSAGAAGAAGASGASGASGAAGTAGEGGTAGAAGANNGGVAGTAGAAGTGAGTAGSAGST